MTIGEKIRELRRERGITQEKLAESLNVSFQAVSKWETNAALPDISLVVPLADFFGVTTDTLFGQDGRAQAEEVRRIEEESSKLARRERYDEQYRLWAEAVDRYPNNLRCLTYFSRMLHRVSTDRSRPDAERVAAGKRAVELAERVVRESTDTFCKYSSIQLLVLEYSDKAKPYYDEKKAAALANNAASFWVCREVLMAHALSGDRAVEANRSNISLFLTKICDIISKLDPGRALDEIDRCEARLRELRRSL